MPAGSCLLLSRILLGTGRLCIGILCCFELPIKTFSRPLASFVLESSAVLAADKGFCYSLWRCSALYWNPLLFWLLIKAFVILLGSAQLCIGILCCFGC